MSKKDYRELWHRGFTDCHKHAIDTKESTKNIVAACSAIAKVESNYSYALTQIVNNTAYKLNSTDEGSTLTNAWDVVIAGVGSIGCQHAKIAEDLLSTQEHLEQWRKQDGEEKRKVTAEGQKYIKELAVFESDTSRAKAAYIRAAKNVEAAVIKRDEALVDPTKKDQILKLSQKVKELVEQYCGARHAYIDSLMYLQAAELVHRDRMIGIMKKYEDIEKARILESRKWLVHILECREKEIAKVLQIVSSMKGMVNKVSEVDDIRNYVYKHPPEVVEATSDFESYDSNAIKMNLNEDLPVVPPALLYPSGVDIEGFAYRVRPVEENTGILGKLFGSRKPVAVPSGDYIPRPPTFTSTPSTNNQSHNDHKTVTNIPANISPGKVPKNPSGKTIPIILYYGNLTTRLCTSEPVLVTALYDYDAETETDLSLRVGDVITVTSKTTGEWWTGTCGGLSGDFPSNFVQETITPIQLEEDDGYVEAVALYEYIAEQESDLSMYEGEMLRVRDMGEPNWLEGMNSSGVTGLVPANYIQYK